ncbi:5'-methylthioadenosine/S-adenosylhomocysteine nucleosidase [Novosphingobium sp.]|uniref:5'-methylthioadenosine/S-adenosylhomocysteine nucleosidase n=1 Tax=Novosphingobium sp. TaxID=1874826 RepID=UPI00333E9E14
MPWRAAIALVAGCFPSLVYAQKIDDVPRTVVMTAFGPEWTALVKSVDSPVEHAINGQVFMTGTIAGKPVVLMKSGVSMVNAAMNTQLVLDRFTVRRIVFSGIAGGVDPALSIGDVVVPDDWGQYLEASFARKAGQRWQPPEAVLPGAPANWQFIFPRGTTVTNAASPPARRFRIAMDPALLALARKVAPGVTMERCVAPDKSAPAAAPQCLPRTPRVMIGGTGVSAGIFADNAAFRRYLQKAWGARVLDMESAAVAQVAYTNMAPAIVFRSLSDLAGGDGDRNMETTFENLASINSAHVVLAFVAALPD